MQLSICDRFPSVSPFDIRKQRFSEVFLLIRRLTESNKYKKKNINSKTGQRVIRRKAGDDWF